MSGNARDPATVAALRGENPMVMARMATGFAAIGDTQHLPGYSLLLTDDLNIDHLADLPCRDDETSSSTCRSSARRLSQQRSAVEHAGSTTRYSATRSPT